MDQKRARKELVEPLAWHTGNVSTPPEQGEASKLAGVSRTRQVRPLSARLRTRTYGANIRCCGIQQLKYTKLISCVTPAPVLTAERGCDAARQCVDNDQISLMQTHSPPQLPQHAPQMSLMQQQHLYKSRGIAARQTDSHETRFEWLRTKQTMTAQIETCSGIGQHMSFEAFTSHFVSMPEGIVGMLVKY